MNIQFDARSFNRGADIVQSAQDVRRRLMSMKEPAKAEPLVAIAPPVEVEMLKEPWNVLDGLYDEHVWEYRRYLKTRVRPLRPYIQKRAEELGVTFEELTGPRRTRRIVGPRQLIMWEIKTIYRPEISYPEIGRMFGGKDHTTVLHAVRHVQELKDRGDIA